MNYKTIKIFVGTLGIFISCIAHGKSYRATEITGYMKTPILSGPHRAFDENYEVTPLGEIEATVSFPFRPSVKNKNPLFHQVLF